MGVIRSDLDEHFSKAIFLLASKHVEESLRSVFETVILDLLELEIAVRQLFRDRLVEFIRILVLERMEMSGVTLCARQDWSTYFEIPDDESSHHQSLGDKIEQVLNAVAFTVVGGDPSTG